MKFLIIIFFTLAFQFTLGSDTYGQSGQDCACAKFPFVLCDPNNLDKGYVVVCTDDPWHNQGGRMPARRNTPWVCFTEGAKVNAGLHYPNNDPSDPEYYIHATDFDHFFTTIPNGHPYFSTIGALWWSFLTSKAGCTTSYPHGGY